MCWSKPSSSISASGSMSIGAWCGRFSAQTSWPGRLAPWQRCQTTAPTWRKLPKWFTQRLPRSVTGSGSSGWLPNDEKPPDNITWEANRRQLGDIKPDTRQHNLPVDKFNRDLFTSEAVVKKLDPPAKPSPGSNGGRTRIHSWIVEEIPSATIHSCMSCFWSDGLRSHLHPGRAIFQKLVHR